MASFGATFANIAVTFVILVAMTAPSVSADEPPLRPKVIAVLKTGEKFEGMLEQFLDGEYWLLADGKTRKFTERDVTSIAFASPQARVVDVRVVEEFSEFDGLEVEERRAAETSVQRGFGDGRWEDEAKCLLPADGNRCDADLPKSEFRGAHSSLCGGFVPSH